MRIEFINWGIDSWNFTTVEDLKNMGWHFERWPFCWGETIPILDKS